ncbi:hypothetical protein AB4Y45_32510 [Paraburkholderia sp. EG287A]|uniref:hypothetical protein n=1 Tax=Paraburkholderia sp. EG287A TaxID=3237012 RepID=UPI0034D3357A
MQRHPEGMLVTLADEAMLESAGVLSGATEAYGLSAETVRLFLLIAGAGEDGLARSKVPRDLAKSFEEHLLPLEMRELVEWQRDKRGRLSYLVLTWKGQEALDAARPRHPAKSLAARRRASVTG